MQKMWKICTVLIVILGIYTCFKMSEAKYRKGDCISFDLHPSVVYTITEKRWFRYVLEDRLILNIHMTDSVSKRVKCSVKP